MEPAGGGPLVHVDDGMERCHLLRQDLDWLPPGYGAIRWTVAGTLWAGLGAASVATAIYVGGAAPFFLSKFIGGVAIAGYYVGDQVARAALRSQLGRLARGQVDLTPLRNTVEGELVHVRGRVRARGSVPSLLDPPRDPIDSIDPNDPRNPGDPSDPPDPSDSSDSSDPRGRRGVYRRLVLRADDVTAVHERARDFLLDDGQGEPVLVEVANARLLAPDPRLVVMPVNTPEAWSLCEVPRLPQLASVVMRWRMRVEQGQRALTLSGHPSVRVAERLLRDGDIVEVLGYKSRVFDPTVLDRDGRETPMRTTLRGGARLPLLVLPEAHT